MRIGEIASNAEFWMGEQFQNSTIFKVKFWFFKLEKNSINLLIFQMVKLGNSLLLHDGKLEKFSTFYNFKNYQISTIDKLIKYSIYKISKFLNYRNLTICKTFKISKISN